MDRYTVDNKLRRCYHAHSKYGGGDNMAIREQVLEMLREGGAVSGERMDDLRE